jgi:DNA-directed RNA polymerase specialized sigma subunit
MEVFNMSHNYVENDELYKEIVAYSKEYKNYKSKIDDGDMNISRPSISPELGFMIREISENLAKKGNFAGYTWKDDMIQDGCLACVLYIHNYKPEYPNAFGYVTSICARAFINHIKKQKKHSLIKDVLANAELEIAMTLEENNGTIDYQEIRKLLIEDKEHA